MTKKNQHVVPHKDGWAVKGAGNAKATAIHPTQQSAITQRVTSPAIRARKCSSTEPTVASASATPTAKTPTPRKAK